MMSLKFRNTELVSRMQQAMEDPALMERTYAQLARINRMFTVWRRIYLNWMRSRIRKSDEPLTVLDIGAGGGDIASSLHRWAQKDGRSIRITAVDPNPEARYYAEKKGIPCEYITGTAESVLEAGRTFDFVISNHLLHHLSDAMVTPFLRTAAALARQRVLINDVVRSRMGYVSVKLMGMFSPPRSLLRTDAPVAVRRGFVPEEIFALLPEEGWRIFTPAPFRLVLLYDIPPAPS